MHVLNNVSLKLYSTMRLGGKARYSCEITTKKELEEAVTWAKSKDIPFIVIGEGSNIVWNDEGFSGLIIINKILGFLKLSEDDDSATFQIGAGENWDAIVGKLANMGLNGVENLSLIPGKTGATPIQNVGAYGQDIAQTLVNVEAYDTTENSHVVLSNQECNFGYRTSRFKQIDKGRYIIISITLRLLKINPTAPFYPSLQHYLDSNNIHEYTPQIIRDAVISIRSDKMPDWHKIANNGSFFANPIVSKQKYEELLLSFPEIIGWDYDGGYKLSAGWLLEKAGLKGYHDDQTGMAISDKTALVIINEHAKSTADLLKFKQKITDEIVDMFGIELEQEPELLP